MATADLFQKITALTAAEGDSGHIRIYIDSNASIPDRTAAILDGGEDPVPAMTDSLRKLEACGAGCVIMPCNTAHYFLPRLVERTELPFVSMIGAAASACRARFPGKAVGILATTGTLSAGLYQEALAAQGAPFLEPGGVEREALMEVIYQGVKAGVPPSRYEKARSSKAWRARGRSASFWPVQSCPWRCGPWGWTCPVWTPRRSWPKPPSASAAIPSAESEP